MVQHRVMSGPSPANPPAPDPQAILAEGEALSAAGRLDQAVAVFEAGLRAYPAADGFRVSLGYLHLRRNERTAARAMFSHVRTAAPGRQDAMVGLAQVLTLNGDHPGAIQLYRQALAIRPDNAGARIALGKALLELGDREAGEAELRRVAGQAPELAGPVLSAMAASPRGRFFLRPSDAARFLAGT